MKDSFLIHNCFSGFSQPEGDFSPKHKWNWNKCENYIELVTNCRSPQGLLSIYGTMCLVGSYTWSKKGVQLNVQVQNVKMWLIRNPSIWRAKPVKQNITSWMTPVVVVRPLQKSSQHSLTTHLQCPS